MNPSDIIGVINYGADRTKDIKFLHLKWQKSCQTEINWIDLKKNYKSQNPIVKKSTT